MKKTLSKICYIAIASVLSLASFALLFVNLRSFFAFDWLVYSDPVYGCFAGITKILLWAIGAAALPLTIICIKKNTPAFKMAMMVYSLSTFIAGAVMAVIFKTDEGIVPLYYILPAALIPALFVITTFFYQSNANE